MSELIINEKELRDLCFQIFQMGLNNAWTGSYSELMNKKIEKWKKNVRTFQ